MIVEPSGELGFDWYVRQSEPLRVQRAVEQQEQSAGVRDERDQVECAAMIYDSTGTFPL